MVSAFNGMPSLRRFLDPAGINPGNGYGHHAKVQMVCDGIRMSGLCMGTADIAFEFLECGLDFPPGPIKLDDLLNRKAKIG